MAPTLGTRGFFLACDGEFRLPETAHEKLLAPRVNGSRSYLYNKRQPISGTFKNCNFNFAKDVETGCFKIQNFNFYVT